MTTTLKEDIDDAMRQEYLRLLRKRERGEQLSDAEQKTLETYEYAHDYLIRPPSDKQ